MWLHCSWPPVSVSSLALVPHLALPFLPLGVFSSSSCQLLEMSQIHYRLILEDSWMAKMASASYESHENRHPCPLPSGGRRLPDRPSVSKKIKWKQIDGQSWCNVIVTLGISNTIKAIKKKCIAMNIANCYAIPTERNHSMHEWTVPENQMKRRHQRRTVEHSGSIHGYVEHQLKHIFKKGLPLWEIFWYWVGMAASSSKHLQQLWDCQILVHSSSICASSIPWDFQTRRNQRNLVC